MRLRGWGVALLPWALACRALNPAFDPGGDDAGSGGAGGSATSTDGRSSTEGPIETDGASQTGGDHESSSGLDDDLCGNGQVDEGEFCDDGVNEGGYGGCTPDCQRIELFCGDGLTEEHEGERCDDGNLDLADGCLPNCLVPHSCLQIRESADAPPSGVYEIRPQGVDAFVDVYCDMVTDGGGYTFVKIDRDAEPSGGRVPAAIAEEICDEFGMQLWIPRTQAHLASGWMVANDPTFGPSAAPTYLSIMGIYPEEPGATCISQPFVSSNPECDWRASDDETFWVNAKSNINEPNGNDGATQTDGSMRYEWNNGGVLGWYDDVSLQGAQSPRFMCDVGDKH